MSDLDLEYRDRIRDAIMRTIIAESVDKATNTAVMRTGEIYSAILTVLAGFASTSEEASSPTRLRHLAEDFAKQLQKRVRKIKEEGGMPFDVVHPDRTN